MKRNFDNLGNLLKPDTPTANKQFIRGQLKQKNNPKHNKNISELQDNKKSVRGKENKLTSPVRCSLSPDFSRTQKLPDLWAPVVNSFDQSAEDIFDQLFPNPSIKKLNYFNCKNQDLFNKFQIDDWLEYNQVGKQLEKLHKCSQNSIRQWYLRHQQDNQIRRSNLLIYDIFMVNKYKFKYEIVRRNRSKQPWIYHILGFVFTQKHLYIKIIYQMIYLLSFMAMAQRPPVKKFESPLIEQVIVNITSKIKDQNFSKIFTNTFPNTLDTTVMNFTVDQFGNPDSYIITGDIDAMWLRDSTNQIWPYMDFINKEEKLQQLCKGLVLRQIRAILIDPYANAFYHQQTRSQWFSDNTTRQFLGVNTQAMNLNLHERKYETDSISAVIRLCAGYHNKTQDSSIFDFNFVKAFKKTIKTFKLMQEDHSWNEKNNHYPYTFQRATNRPTDTVVDGIGNKVNRTGLIRTFFRASDDSTVHQFNIPENAQASAVLVQLCDELEKAELSWAIKFAVKPLIKEAKELAKEIKDAIYKYGVKDGYFLYEIDGFGRSIFMDDSNQPSLISLPIYGFVDIKDPIYLKTRARALSSENPWYFEGKAAKGIGGPHIGADYIWPMALVSQALTTDNKDEIEYCLKTLINTTGGRFFMHESFHKNDATQFTRAWFAWANGLFGELTLMVAEKYPDLLEKYY